MDRRAGVQASLMEATLQAHTVACEAERVFEAVRPAPLFRNTVACSGREPQSGERTSRTRERGLDARHLLARFAIPAASRFGEAGNTGIFQSGTQSAHKMRAHIIGVS